MLVKGTPVYKQGNVCGYTTCLYGAWCLQHYPNSFALVQSIFWEIPTTKFPSLNTGWMSDKSMRRGMKYHYWSPPRITGALCGEPIGKIIKRILLMWWTYNMWNVHQVWLYFWFILVRIGDIPIKTAMCFEFLNVNPLSSLQAIVRCIQLDLCNSLQERLYAVMMTSSNGNIFRVTGLLCGEFTGHRWIPRTKASDVELWCFLWSAPEPTDEQTMETPVIWDTIALIMTSL